MELTDALLGEHGAFRALLDGIEEMASYAGEVARIESAMAVFSAEVTRHAKLEEDLLFPALEPHLDSNDLIAKMRSEHLEIRSGLDSIEDARDLDQALDAVQHTLETARRHFDNEEKVLYATAKKVLDEDTLTRLGEEWADARNITMS
jgi:hemerythrin-like domain-containing protein